LLFIEKMFRTGGRIDLTSDPKLVLEGEIDCLEDGDKAWIKILPEALS
jgi:hypothetical protein